MKRFDLKREGGSPLDNRITTRHTVAVILSAITAMVFPAISLAQDKGADAADRLESAVERYDEGDYVGAQHILEQIDASVLSQSEQSRHAEYLQRSSLAASMHKKANDDLRAAEQFVADGRLDEARDLIETISQNPYADSQTKASAKQLLTKSNVAELVPVQMTQSAESEGTDLTADEAEQLRSLRATALTRRGDEALRDGDHVEARRFYSKAIAQVPGYPEAVAGLQRLSGHHAVESGAIDLLDRIESRNAIAWQRTEASYREAEREVRDHVLNNRYEVAQQAMLRAKQIVESGKAFADPIARYHALRHDAKALEEYVVDEERRYNENALQRQRTEALTQSRARERRAMDARRERINGLMTQARQHRRDRDYDSAINVAKQVLVIDPSNDNAQWMVDDLEDQRSYHIQREQRDKFYKAQRDALVDVEDVRIPITTEITYPPNWREIIGRPTRLPPGSEQSRKIDSRLQSKLNSPVEIDFNNDPFNTVIQKFAQKNDVNISVVWKDLAAAGIPSDTPVNLQLNNQVPMRRALREVLDQVGGAGVELGYYADEGVIKVATREWLNENTETIVYDVRDLLMPIPHFDDAPQMDLTSPDVYINHDMPSGGRTIFPDEDNEEVRERIKDFHAQTLIDLIRTSVEPDSWRKNSGTVGSIAELNGQLVITQTPTGHARVGGLLSKLREQRAVQVAVEARFITVQSNYLEELGMDLDIVLNAGNAGFDFIPGPGGTRLIDPTLGSQLLLPRSFSRLGFTPAAPAGLGTALAVGPQSATQAIQQPFEIPGLVPARGNSGIGGRSGTPVPILNNVLQFTDPGQLTSDLPGTFAGNPTLQPAFQIFGSFLDNIQVDFLIRATQADSRTTLLTAPRLVLFNGQRAWVAVVNQSSFVSSLEPVVDAQGQAPETRTIETGAVLDAQAAVSADKRYVTLTLRPSVGRLLGIDTFQFNIGPGGGGLFVQLPNITRQVVRTTVSVPDGGTLLIGGQKLAGEIEVEGGVPVLSKIPILKRFYNSRALVKDEQVLLILIKPKIIIQAEAEQEAFPSFTEG